MMKTPDLHIIANEIVSGLQLVTFFMNYNPIIRNNDMSDSNKDLGLLDIEFVSFSIKNKPNLLRRFIWFLIGFKYRKPEKVKEILKPNNNGDAFPQSITLSNDSTTVSWTHSSTLQSPGVTIREVDNTFVVDESDEVDVMEEEIDEEEVAEDQMWSEISPGPLTNLTDEELKRMLIENRRTAQALRGEQMMRRRNEIMERRNRIRVQRLEKRLGLEDEEEDFEEDMMEEKEEDTGGSGWK